MYFSRSMRPKFILILIAAGFAILYLKQNSETKPIVPDNENTFRWPPESPAHLLNPKTGFYDLTLRPQIISNANQIDWIRDYAMQLEILLQDKHTNESHLRQLVRTDEKYRMGSEYPNYLLYPQAIEIRPIIEAIRQGEPISQVPINNPNLHIKTTPRSVCYQKLAQEPHTQTPKSIYDLVIIVKSCVFCFDQRTRVRNTYMQPHLWSNFTVGFAFQIGLPVSNPSLVYNFTGLRISMPAHVPKFENLTPEQSLERAKLQLEKEMETFGDLIIGTFDDTYFNLTLKQITSFRWASSFCHGLTKLFIFIDHDRSIIPEALIRFISKIPTDLRSQLAGGMPSLGYSVLRSESMETGNKWAISEEEIPWKLYPPHPPGPCYMLGSQAVAEIAVASAFTKLFRIEDAYFGIVFHKIHRHFVEFEGFTKNFAKILYPFKAVCVPNGDADRIYDWEKGRYK